jgi:hypothetical protein
MLQVFTAVHGVESTMFSPITKSRKKLTGSGLLALLLMGVASVSVQAAPVIYNQPETLLEGFSSQTGVPSTTYDDFIFATGATITDVHWHGFFSAGGETASITSFTIQFWNDNAGQPGSAASAAQTIAGNAGQTNGHPCITSSTCFDYTFDPLTTPFQAAAGVRYWLSIVATLPFPPQWFWETGTGGNSISYIDIGGQRLQEDSDLAFDLTGALDVVTVPEPATLTLLGLGLAAFGMSRRRDR